MSWQVLVQSLGMSIGIAVVVGMLAIGGCLAGITWWVRRATRGNVYCFFIEPNKQITTKLLKVKGNHVETTGPSGDPEMYMLAPSKAMWRHWPDGVPNFVKEPIPSLLYVRNRAEPLDPYSGKKIITGSSLFYMQDEGMLKQTWKEAKEAIGIRGGVQNRDILLLALVAGILVLTVVSLYMSWTASSNVSDLKGLLMGR